MCQLLDFRGRFAPASKPLSHNELRGRPQPVPASTAPPAPRFFSQMDFPRTSAPVWFDRGRDTSLPVSGTLLPARDSFHLCEPQSARAPVFFAVLRPAFPACLRRFFSPPDGPPWRPHPRDASRSAPSCWRFPIARFNQRCSLNRAAPQNLS